MNRPTGPSGKHPETATPTSRGGVEAESRRLRPWLLCGLLVACLAPRIGAAVSRDGLFPDSVVYLQTMDALEEGDSTPMLVRFGPNVYPVVLGCLRAVGLDGLPAARFWSVAMATLAVLPLFGWVRRQFNDDVAAVACLLYAFHPRLIYVSPLIIRDPTFWLLFNLTLYFAWRAATEARLWQFLGAGCAFLLAAFTRSEGWLLALPLAVWIGSRVATSSARRRIVAGAAAATAVAVVALIAVDAVFLPERSDWHLIRAEHLRDATFWCDGLWSPGEPAASELLEFPVVRSGWDLVGRVMIGCVKAYTYPYGLLLLVGLLSGWRLFLRVDQQALAAISWGLLAAITLRYSRKSIDEMRYFLPMVMIGLPYVALGALRSAALVSQLVSRRTAQDPPDAAPRAWTPRVRAATLWGLMAVLAGTGWMHAESFQPVEHRQIAMGKWIRRNLGRNRRIAGSIKHMSLTAHYAEGRLVRYPGHEEYTDEPLLETVETRRPGVLLLWPVLTDRRPSADYSRLLASHEALGYTKIPPRSLPPSGRQTTVLVRTDLLERLHKNLGLDPVRNPRFEDSDRRADGPHRRPRKDTAQRGARTIQR